MTLAELRTYDIPAAWARLTPEQQARIGAAAIGWQMAQFVADDAINFDDMDAAQQLANDAHDGTADAVEAAFPDIPWD